ncbi:Oar protein [Acidisarcina polymorpha]|uniref:Oar protein n=1 Tax=Acidisarcina polymorpha TaxID=2211140 RepID=A0A2Z5G582_9BACT|nr:Oar protein [Acidisarcina polymorpha]
MKTAVSNDSGAYTFPGLNIGTYDIKVTATGFEAVVQQGLELNVSQTLRADIALTVGSVNETVTVAANALQVQADSNVVSTLISADQISEIATQNRNLTALATLGLGVSSGLPDSNTPTSVASSSFISVNGLRHAHNIWLIDGGEADDRGGAGGASIMPSQDAIAQFEMLTSNYPPDYGISSGATISLALKSGTQNFHGTLWEFNRNTDYNANSYFNKQANPVVARQIINYNIYGFNIGGPIFIPKHYNTSRQRTFFFVNEEWRKLKQASAPNVVQAIPAADFPVAGQNLNYVTPAFSSAIQLQVPVVGDPAFNARLAAAGIPVPTANGPKVYFPNNVIPASLFDPNALLYLGTGVFPAGNPGTDKVVSSASQPIDVRDDVVRIDHRITDKWAILGHYLGDSVTQSYASPMLGWSGASYNTITSVLNNPSNSAAVKLSGTISPSLLAEASFNYDGNVIGITNSPNSQVPAGFGVNRFFANPSTNLPGLNLGAPYNTQELPGSAPWKNAARDYSPKVDISYTIGKHAMKYGFSYNRYTKNQQIFGDPGGNFNIGSLSGDSAVDFILGLSNTYDQAQALPIRHYVNQTTSAYVMDNWRVTPRLTLQLGVRYDALPHAYERQNNLSNFDPATYIPTLIPSANIFLGNNTNQLNPAALTNFNGGAFYLNGVQIAGQNHFPRGLVQNDYNTIQPRVGFSNDLFGDGKTILRGGIGSFYERVQGNDVYNAAANEPFFNDPQATSVYVSDPHTAWTTGQTAQLPNFAQGITTLATTYKAPGVVQFSLGVQREVAPSVVWVVQYVGNLAWHQPVRRQINNYSLNTPLGGTNNPNSGTLLPTDTRANAGDPQDKSGTNLGGTSLSNGDQLRNYPGIGQIAQQENTSNANYSGFQTGIRAQNKHGLTGEFDYTWSHEIDLTSDDNNCCLSNPYNLKYDKGSGGLDRRHIVSINYIYQLPIFTQSTGLTHTLLGGWELAGVVVAESGVILNNTAGGSAYGGPGLSIGYDTIGLGGGYQNRPNINGKVHYPHKQLEWFDPTVFSAPIPAWAGGANQGFGSASRDSIVGPGRLNFSTSLYKSFAIKEYAHFEFRAESFNTFNHTQYNNVGYQFGSGNFGQVTSTFDPRTLELGAKLIF